MLLFSWADLSLLGKIYWIIAIPSTAIFLILLILSFFGGDTDGLNGIDGVDGTDFHGGDIDIGEGFSGFIISFKSVMSFLMMFGWSGIISMSFKMTHFVSLFIAFITGLITLFLVAGLLYLITKMQYDGSMKIENAIGKIGTVVLYIPPKKQGYGQIQVNVQGTLKTLNAKTEEKEEIKSGTKVIVIDILENNELLVVTQK